MLGQASTGAGEGGTEAVPTQRQNKDEFVQICPFAFDFPQALNSLVPGQQTSHAGMSGILQLEYSTMLFTFWGSVLIHFLQPAALCLEMLAVVYASSVESH